MPDCKALVTECHGGGQFVSLCAGCSYTPQTRTEEMRMPGMGLGDIQRLGQQDVAQGGLEARIYAGYVCGTQAFAPGSIRLCCGFVEDCFT